MSVSSVQYLLKSATITAGEKVAVTLGNEIITFSELGVKVDKLASYLISLNLKKGARIGILSNKTIDQVISVLAVLSTPYVFVPISNLLKASQIKFIIDDAGIEVVLIDKSKLKILDQSGYKGKVISCDRCEREDLICFDEIFRVYNISLFEELYAHDNAAIIYTSGSTGLPKGIVLSHRNLFDGARIISYYLKLKQEDIIAGVLSFTFDYGLNQIFCTLYKRATLALHTFFLPNDFFQCLIDQNITVLPLMPVFLSRMFSESRFSDFDPGFFDQVRLVCSSGGRVTSRMIENIGKYFRKADFYSMYGLTEAFRSTYLDPRELKVRPASIGKAIPDVEIYVVNDEGKECGPNQPGELVHRGGVIAKGYWNREQDTLEKFRSIKTLSRIIDMDPATSDEIVVYSGDYVYKDEDGFLYFISRKDEMIKSSGYRISPFEIETTVQDVIKDIRECAVFSIENQEIGQEIVMVYTSEKEELDKEEIIFELKKHLPNYMIPTMIIYRKNLPVTIANQGKINKSVLKEEIEKEYLRTR
jgi:acyl-CoA synthetase (AMP-forming)/AMP-acid ligase II